MRPRKPGFGQWEPPEAVESGWGDDLLDPTAEILDTPERTSPLTVERVGSLRFGAWQSYAPEWGPASKQLAGQIADDNMDGRPVYAAPPRRARPVDRMARLRERVTPWVLPIMIVAIAQAVTILADAMALASWSPVTVLSLVCRLGYTFALALLPVGVLLWRPDAWHSARLVLVGSILWTTGPAVAGPALWIVRRLLVQLGDFGIVVAAVSVVVVAVSCLGPVIVAVGLERTRGNRDIPLRPLMPSATVMMAMVLPFSAAQWLGMADSTIDPVHLARAFIGSVLPLQVLCLCVLAYSCLAAVAAGDAQQRLWQCCAAGAVVLAVLSSQQINLAVPPAIVGEWVPAGSNWMAVAMDAALLAGSGAMLMGFSSPVWSAARDAAPAAVAPPEDVFTWGPAADVETGKPLPMAGIVALAAGADHALALDEFGRVGAWGDDTLGQIDIPEGLSDVTAIAAGDGWSMALRADGSIAAWGAGDRGQTDVPGDLGAAVAIAAGSDFGLALRSDGTVVGWGDGASAVIPVPPDLTGVTSISAGAHHALALRRDGTVVAWGDSTSHQTRVPTKVRQATAISAGGDFSLALLEDGTVVAWGDNRYGQLDVPAGLQNVTAIAAGVSHALALRADGDLVGWGGGQLRIEAHPWRLVDFKAVAAGDGFSLGLRAA